MDEPLEYNRGKMSKRKFVFLLIELFLLQLFGKNIAMAQNRVIINNQSSGQSTTDVKIENNGAVNTFHTEGNQTVNWTSDDGKSSVKINSNNNASTKTNIQNNSPTALLASPTAEVKPLFVPQTNIFTKVENQILRVFNILNAVLRRFFS